VLRWAHFSWINGQFYGPVLMHSWLESSLSLSLTWSTLRNVFLSEICIVHLYYYVNLIFLEPPGDLHVIILNKQERPRPSTTPKQREQHTPLTAPFECTSTDHSTRFFSRAHVYTLAKHPIP
jgi:hypothetical protein